MEDQLGRLLKREPSFRIVDRSLKAPLVRKVPGKVKEFDSLFRAGARAPSIFLENLGPGNETLLREWLATPPEKRVFLVGSGKDHALAQGLRTELEKNGFRLFFYKFCPLCGPKDVGAFFKTSTTTILMDTPFGKASPFVSQEVFTAIRLQGGRRATFLISREDLVTGQRTLVAIVSVAGNALSAAAGGGLAEVEHEIIRIAEDDLRLAGPDETRSERPVRGELPERHPARLEALADDTRWIVLPPLDDVHVLPEPIRVGDQKERGIERDQ